MSYIAWNDLAGHGGIKKLLQAMIAQDRVPHALLFAGPDGVGKMTAARIFAAGLLCGTSGGRPCGNCVSCRMVAAGNHPDFHVLEPDGASIRIDQIRAIRREAALAAYAGHYRLYVIRRADKMTEEAANSLLKVLEEPPDHLVFILTTAKRYALLDTVLSRCRLVSFYTLPVSVLTQFLRSRHIGELAEAAARISGGRPERALALAAPGGLKSRDRAVDIVAALPGMEMKSVWEAAQEIGSLDSSELRLVLENMSLVLRDLLVLRAAGRNELLFNADIAGRLATMQAAWNEPQLTRALERVRDCLRALVANANARLAAEALLIRLGDLTAGAAGKEG